MRSFLLSATPAHSALPPTMRQLRARGGFCGQPRFVRRSGRRADGAGRRRGGWRLRAAGPAWGFACQGAGPRCPHSAESAIRLPCLWRHSGGEKMAPPSAPLLSQRARPGVWEHARLGKRFWAAGRGGHWPCRGQCPRAGWVSFAIETQRVASDARGPRQWLTVVAARLRRTRAGAEFNGTARSLTADTPLSQENERGKFSRPRVNATHNS
jgi:hypothetical protein